MVRVATEQAPEALRQTTNLLLALLHPDGDFTDAERDRRRGITIGNQGVDGSRRLTGWITPELAATLEPIVAKWSAPGMCNPADDNPTIDGEPSADAIDRDSRTPAQRRHDALLAMGRNLLCSGELGQHNGLPTTIIVTTTLQELESGAGHAITAGGTRLPMADLIAQAAHSFHYLAVFDKHTGAALHLGRTKRCASGAQRIVLYAKDRGCTRPGCMASGYRCQVHHAVADWKNGGQTNIDDLTLACGPDNNLIERTEWITRKRKDGRTEWIPPPHLDTGQTRVNDFHHPEHLLRPPEGDPPEGEDPLAPCRVTPGRGAAAAYPTARTGRCAAASNGSRRAACGCARRASTGTGCRRPMHFGCRRVRTARSTPPVQRVRRRPWPPPPPQMPSAAESSVRSARAASTRGPPRPAAPGRRGP